MRRYSRNISLLVSYLLFSSAGLWAIEVGTSINTISHEGVDQVLGSFTLTVRDNEFSGASTDTPIYVRFQLSSANGWSRSLVDQRPDAPESVSNPINIALYASTSNPINPSLPPDAVQLVRLVEGEKSGWLRVIAPTDEWLSSAAGTTAPDSNHSVAMTLGVSGENSVRNNANTASGGNEDSVSGLVRSTILRADYRNTPNFDIGDLENLDFIGLDQSTSGVISGSPREGNILAIGFSNDSAVARGDGLVPCFEYHFDALDLDGPAAIVPINRMNLFWRETYCIRVPTVYLTNSSDFQWNAGSRFFLTVPDFNPDYRVSGANPPFRAPDTRKVQLTDADLALGIANDQARWVVEKIYVNNSFVGYEIRLESGVMNIWESISLDGLAACTEGWFDGSSLVLKARAYYSNQNITNGEPKPLGDLIRTTATLKRVEDDFYREVLPYTGFDRGDWDTEIRVVNPNGEAVTFTAFFYQRQGIHTRSILLEQIPAHGLSRFNPVETFGGEFGKTLTWMELLSDKPCQVVAVIASKDGQSMDIFSGSANSSASLFGPHIPTNTQLWQTTAYLVSAEYDLNSDFDLILLNGLSQLNGLRAPRYSMVLRDEDFQQGSGISPWIRIDASAPAAAGTLFIERRDNQSQLASIPLNLAPNKLWHFDHLGDWHNGWWNGLILFNPGAEEALIELEIEGQVSDGPSTRILNLGAGEKVADLVSQLFPGGSAPNRLRVVSETPVLAGLLLGRQDEEILTYVPGDSPAGKDFIAPFLHHAEGDWTGLALVNLRSNPARGTITPLTDSGLAGPVREFSVSPQGRELVLLDNTGEYSHFRIESSMDIRVYGITGGVGRLATVPLFPAH